MIVVSWMQFLQQAALLTAWILLAAATYHLVEQFFFGSQASNDPERPKPPE